jgi:hypothetical protein
MSGAKHFANQAIFFADAMKMSLGPYRAAEQQFEKLDKDNPPWTLLSRSIRAAYTYGSIHLESLQGFVLNTANYESAKSIFGGSKKAAAVISEWQSDTDDYRKELTRWENLAKKNGITLCREDSDTEIALLADAELLDIYKYRDIKFTVKEAQEMIEEVKSRFSISESDFKIWLSQNNLK